MILLEREHWINKSSHLRFEASLCLSCEELTIQNRKICRNCGEGCIKEPLSGKGKIYSFTTVEDPDYAPPYLNLETPYTIAIIELEEGIKVTAILTDFKKRVVERTIDGKKVTVRQIDAKIDQPVEMVTRILHSDSDERGQIVYGYRFRPVISS